MRAVAIVPAAGEGRRLGGVAKALLRARSGESYLARIAAAARWAGCGDVVAIIGDPHGRAVEAAGIRGIRLVWNPAPERGMASSIACGIVEAGEAEIALLWPVDHPGAAAATARLVLEAAAASRIVVPTCAGRGGHPTAFGRAVWPELLAAVKAPDGARSVVQREPARVLRVPVDDPGIVADVDLPADRGQV